MIKYLFTFLIFFLILFLLFYKTNQEVYVCHGNFRVIDGDTFYFNNIKIRIIGIDALELHKQKEYVLKRLNKNNLSCLKYYAYLAKEELDRILREYCVKIKFYGKDKYGRTLAKVYNCSRNICTDVGRYLVLNGLALSFGNYYKKVEKLAKGSNKGFWSCN